MSTDKKEEEGSGQESEEELFECAYCKKPTNEFCCEYCDETFYCCEEHARLHWKVHQEECKGQPKKAEQPQPAMSSPAHSDGKGLLSPNPQFSPVAKQEQKPPSKSNRPSMADMQQKRRGTMEQVTLSAFRRLTQPPQDPISPTTLRRQLKPKAAEVADDDAFESEDNTPFDPKYPRAKAKRRVLYHLYRGNNERAKQYAEGQYLHARAELDQAENDVEHATANLDEIMQSFLMYAKCILLTDGANSDTVREILGILSENIMGCVKINYRSVRESLEGEEVKERKAGFKDLEIGTIGSRSGHRHGTGPKQSSTGSFSDLKRILHMHGIIAAMYKVMENQVECERMYVSYCKIVEKLFGVQTVEASNCYFYLGVYYYEEQQYEKALICMRKSLFNRGKELGERHISCADCHFNIGLIHKRLNQYPKAKSELELALAIRRERIGKSSLPSAMVLEELGKLCLETSDFKNAFGYLQECYEIRKKLLKDPKNMSITRVSLLLIYLNRKIDKELNRSSEKEKQRVEKNARMTSALSQVLPTHSQSSLDSVSRPARTAEREELKGPPVMEAAPRVFSPAIPEKSSEIYEEQLYDLPADDKRDSITLSDFVPGGLDQLLTYHIEDNSDEGIIDSIIFLLSLDKRQMEYLNKCQIGTKEDTPLFINLEFKKMLSEYQMSLLAKSTIQKIPRGKYLKKSKKMIEVANIKLMPELARHACIQLRADSSLSESNLYKLMQANSDFYKVLNDWQVEILNRVVSNKLPLGLFIRCIKDNQIKMFKAYVLEELQSLEEEHVVDSSLEEDALEPLEEYQKPKGSGKRGPRLDMQEEILDFVESKLSQAMLPQLNISTSDEFLNNLNHSQIVQAAQLNSAKRGLMKQAPTVAREERDKDWKQFTAQLREFIRNLDQREAYQFGILNRFMLGIESDKKEESKAPLLLHGAEEGASTKPVPDAGEKEKEKEKEKKKKKMAPQIEGSRTFMDETPGRASFGAIRRGEPSEDESLSEETPDEDVIQELEREEEANELVSNVFNNPIVLNEMKKTLPRKHLEIIAEHPEILGQFLRRPPKSPSN